MGSNHRRLSRRFYREPADATVDASDLTLWGPGVRPDPFPLLSPVVDAPGVCEFGKEARLCLFTSESMCIASGPRWQWSPRTGRCWPTGMCPAG
jgi:hypothetical protein